jgi:hypothetical protein
MGRSFAVRFSVHFRLANYQQWTPHEWVVRKSSRHAVPYGKPTSENLEKYCQVYENSTLPGGVNERLGRVRILESWIVDNNTGQVLARVIRG